MAGKLRATKDPREAVLDSDVSLVCVGTPSRANGALDLSHVWAVAEQIGDALRDKPDPHVVVLRSTVMPGTADRVSDILAERSGKSAGDGFAVVVESRSSCARARRLPTSCSRRTRSWAASDEAALDRVAELYRDLEAPLHRACRRASPRW